MLEAHERYREEYGKKYANLTPEQKKQKYLEEIREGYEFAVEAGMKIETIEIDENEDSDNNASS